MKLSVHLHYEKKFTHTQYFHVTLISKYIKNNYQTISFIRLQYKIFNGKCKNAHTHATIYKYVLLYNI